nr:type II toxin-antitoxin system HicA family toxin [Devosia psychrophila]
MDATGDHHQFIHPERAGRVTVPHPNNDMPFGTVDRFIGRPTG